MTIVTLSALTLATMVVQPEPPATLLSGPSVASEEAAPSLVRHTYEGELRRLDRPAPEAALDLLKLDEATLERISGVLTERAAAMDRIFVENIELIVDTAGARSAGEAEAYRAGFTQIVQKMRPLLNNGGLRADLMAALPVASRGEFERLVDEYHEALVGELRREAEAEERPTDRRAIRRRLLQEGIGIDLRRSYERVIVARNEDFERLIAHLRLTPEQEREVRAIIQENGEMNGLESSSDDRAGVFRSVIAVLDRAQRRALVEYLRPGG